MTIHEARDVIQRARGHGAGANTAEQFVVSGHSQTKRPLRGPGAAQVGIDSCEQVIRDHASMMGHESPIKSRSAVDSSPVPRWNGVGQSCPMTALQQNLDRLRRRAGLSMRALALKAKLNETAVKAIMHGKSGSPREQTVRALALALGCRVADLTGETPSAAVERTQEPLAGYGERIATIRIDREQSQEEFASDLAVPVEMVRLWEGGLLEPDVSALGKLRRHGISADWVLFGDRGDRIAASSGPAPTQTQPSAARRK